VPITTKVVKDNDKALSVTCNRSVVFSRYSGYLHDITEILLKVALQTITLTLKFSVNDTFLE